MNLALERYADNSIIDELVLWPPRTQKIRSIRACFPIFRKPFIEIELADAQRTIRHFPKDDFAEHWAEASIILGVLCDIRLVSDFSFTAHAQAEALIASVQAVRAQCIAESQQLFEQGMYQQFLYQYGEDCRDLPAAVCDRIEQARQMLYSSG